MKKIIMFFALLLILGLATEAVAQDLWEFTDTRVLYIGDFKIGASSINGDNTAFVSDNRDITNPNIVFVNDSIITDPLVLDVPNTYSANFFMASDNESLIIAGVPNWYTGNTTEREAKIVIRDFNNLAVTNSINFRFMRLNHRNIRDIKIDGDSLFILMNGIMEKSRIEKTHGGESAGTLKGSGTRNSLLIFDKTTNSILEKQFVIEDEFIEFSAGSLVVTEEFIYFVTFKVFTETFTVHKLNRNFEKVDSVIIPWYINGIVNYNHGLHFDIRTDVNGDEVLFTYYDGYSLRIYTENMEVLESPPADLLVISRLISTSYLVGIDYIDNAYITTFGSENPFNGSWVQRFESDNGFRTVAQALIIRGPNGEYYAQPTFLSSTVVDGRLRILALFTPKNTYEGGELFANGVRIADGTQSPEDKIVFETFINVNSSTGPIDQGYESISSPQATHSIIGPSNVITHYGVKDLSAVHVERVMKSESTHIAIRETNPIDFVENSLLNSFVTKSLQFECSCKETYVNYFERAVHRAPNPDSVNLAPAFSEVMPENLEVRENENFSLILKAIDLNTDDILLYDIMNSDDSLHFILNDSVLHFVETHDFEKPSDANGDNVYVVNLRVTDGDNLSDSTVINIRVTGYSDEDPVINDTVISILENELDAGMIIATDADFDTLVYSIIGDSNGIFDIDSASGLLFLDEVLDYDDPLVDRIYQLSVKVRDVSGASDTASVVVRLIGINDNSPVISYSSGSNRSSIEENTNFITTITVADLDLPNDRVTIDIVGPLSDLFSISNTGELSFIESPDYENPKSGTNNIYTVAIRATDDGDNLSDSIVINIRVTGYSDEDPVINDTVISILENELDVGMIIATDADFDTLVYSIIGDSNGIFDIDSVSGLLFLDEVLDYDDPLVDTIYQLSVKVRDVSGASDTASVVVRLIGINDNSPVISYSSGSNRSSIEENTNFITTITVADLDLPNDRVTMDIVGSLSDLFSISNTGELSFIESPDYENPKSGTNNIYTVTIRATDNGGNESFSDFVVEVTDVEDEPLSIVTISPNPSYGAGSLNIDCTVCQIAIFAINGKIVRDYYYSGTGINISSLPNGIYVIVVIRNDAVSKHRIVKN